MKKLKNLLLPVAVVLIGAGAAFATNTAKEANNSMVPGYLFESSSNQCVQKRSDCSPNGSVICTWKDASGQSHNLSEQINGTTCGNELFEP
ncbi:MAG: DUF6520 family protein [Bacteroidales bacterium]|nr:DUF6520 family protein [Bacteroidales bacterium]